MACDGIVHAFKVVLPQYTWGMKTNEHSCRHIAAFMHVTSRGANTTCHKSAQEVQAYQADTSKKANSFSLRLNRRNGLWRKICRARFDYVLIYCRRTGGSYRPPSEQPLNTGNLINFEKKTQMAKDDGINGTNFFIY